MAGPSLARLGITSTLRGEGRTSIATAMATIQRQDYNRTVALVDMDFENPALVRRYGCEPGPGLAEVARGRAVFDKALHRVADGMFVVPGGLIAESIPRSVADILRADLLSQLERRVDVIIVDLPPLLGSGAGPIAARAADNLVLVVRAGVTPVARIKEATADLHVRPAVVLNGSHSSLPAWLRRLLGR
jgi:Mrp family chromosome partitioning ATPase